MRWGGLLARPHVMDAVATFGANLTYRFWIRGAAGEPAVLPFVLRKIRTIDRRIANPAYLLLLVTGLGMAFNLRIPVTTPWLLTSLVLYAMATLLGVLAHAPVARRQRALLETDGSNSPVYVAAAKQADLLGVLVTVDVFVIVFLMVAKPALWA
jgi:uncharacterized membrane protein